MRALWGNGDVEREELVTGARGTGSGSKGRSDSDRMVGMEVWWWEVEARMEVMVCGVDEAKLKEVLMRKAEKYY